MGNGARRQQQWSVDREPTGDPTQERQTFGSRRHEAVNVGGKDNTVDRNLGRIETTDFGDMKNDAAHAGVDRDLLRETHHRRREVDTMHLKTAPRERETLFARAAADDHDTSCRSEMTGDRRAPIRRRRLQRVRRVTFRLAVILFADRGRTWRSVLAAPGLGEIQPCSPQCPS